MLVRALLLSLLPLTVPVGWLLWVRSRALRAAERDPTAAWFAYVRAVQHASIAIAPAWMLGVQIENVTRLVRASLAPFGPAVVTLGVVVGNRLPLLIAAIAFVAITAALQRRVRDVGQSFQGDILSAVWIFPALFVLGAGMSPALVLYLLGAGVGAVLLAVASIFVAVKLVSLRRRAVRDELLTLTAGALHDRVLALASRARVKVQHILVLPKSRTRLANAFAMGG